jgi:hypothetical protein
MGSKGRYSTEILIVVDFVVSGEGSTGKKCKMSIFSVTP